MLIIDIPENFIEEKRYVIDFMVGELLGLSYKISVTIGNSYTILLPNSNKIIIRDDFFRWFPDGLSYLSENAIPTKTEEMTNEFVVDRDLPVLYGNEEIERNRNTIYCGADIFASAFFMLTRWEEAVTERRYPHNRFPGSESLAYRCGFLSRPVINEYAEMLGNMMERLEFFWDRGRNRFHIVPTHDVDLFYFPTRCRDFIADILKRGKGFLALERLRSKISGGNPYDTFDQLMKISERAGVESRFYFKAGGKTSFDNNNYSLGERRIQILLERIKERGHIIGFHPSYATYNDLRTWGQEKEALERVANQEVKEGRQHFLRFEVPKTWQIWESHHMEVDSSMAYSDHEGFRCGTNNVFRVFDIKERRALNLRERPTVIIDGSLIIYRKLEPGTADQILKEYKEKCQKYRMPFTVLFHNHFFYDIEGLWELYTKVF